MPAGTALAGLEAAAGTALAELEAAEPAGTASVVDIAPAGTRQAGAGLQRTALQGADNTAQAAAAAVHIAEAPSRTVAAVELAVRTADAAERQKNCQYSAKDSEAVMRPCMSAMHNLVLT